MRLIGPDKPTFIIAEAGINHNGDVETAESLIKTAADSGADAVKFQFWNAEEFHSDPEHIERLHKLQFSDAEWRELKTVADEHDIPFFASVFSEERVDFLVDDIEAPLIKIASGDLTHLPLLEYIATKEEISPVIVSTGMGSIGEVEKAVNTLNKENVPVYLLECISSYPVATEDLNLSAMDTLAQTFDCTVGFSDHTTGIEAPIAAVALGARIIEKHFTLDRSMEGPDHELSLAPDGFREMVNKIRAVERSHGDGIKRPQQGEESSRHSMRRGLKAACSIDKGHQLTTSNIKVARPADGIEPGSRSVVLGRRTREPLEPNDPITWDVLIE